MRDPRRRDRAVQVAPACLTDPRPTAAGGHNTRRPELRRASRTLHFPRQDPVKALRWQPMSTNGSFRCWDWGILLRITSNKISLHGQILSSLGAVLTSAEKTQNNVLGMGYWVGEP